MYIRELSESARPSTRRPYPLRNILFTLLPILLLLSACDGIFGNDDEDSGVVASLEIRHVYPADSTLVQANSIYNVSIDFNRVVSLSEIYLRMIPDPAIQGEIQKTGSGRNVTWFDVFFDDAFPVYRLLIDGTSLQSPQLIKIFTGAPPVGSFSGSIMSSDSTKVRPLGAVVYAYPESAPFNPLQPTLEGLHPASCTVTQIISPDGGGPYGMGMLPVGNSYIVIAILDTNSDARYDPATDWWGYYRIKPEISPMTVISGSLFDVVTTVDITLRPPH